jgi:hypothetical protein
MFQEYKNKHNTSRKNSEKRQQKMYFLQATKLRIIWDKRPCL